MPGRENEVGRIISEVALLYAADGRLDAREQASLDELRRVSRAMDAIAGLAKYLEPPRAVVREAPEYGVLRSA